MNSSGLFDRIVLSATQFWSARDARERRMLKIGALTVMLGLVYATLIAPPLTGIASLNKSLPELRQQAEQAKALASEAATLSGRSAQPVPVPSRDDIETSLELSGIKAQSIALSGNTLNIQLVGVSFAGLLGWLRETRNDTLFAITEASVTALDNPDTVNANLTLQRPTDNQ